MDKKTVLNQLITQLISDIEMTTQSALAAKEAAIHQESKAEDQYDTRGLEASYLAGAQASRVSEMEELLAIYRNLDLRTFDSNTPISATALVELRSDEKTVYCFLLPKGGGRSTSYAGKTVQVTTPQSPLGAALLGRKVGDEIEIISPTVREYEIVGIF